MTLWGLGIALATLKPQSEPSARRPTLLIMEGLLPCLTCVVKLDYSRRAEHVRYAAMQVYTEVRASTRRCACSLVDLTGSLAKKGGLWSGW